MSYSYSLASREDISQLTCLFNSLLPESLPSKLGNAFLGKHFFPALMNNQQETPIYLYKNGDDIMSFAVFSVSSASIIVVLRKIRLAIIYGIIKNSVRNPRLLLEIFFGYRNKVISSLSKQKIIMSSYLVYLGTSTGYQGRGCASQLLAHCFTCDEKLAKKDCIVEADKSNLIKFYHMNNFVECGERKRYGGNMVLMIREENI